MKVAKAVYEITKSLPEEERYGLSAQMRRSAISISANIAEGSSRRTAAEFARFLEISLGSSFELETYLEMLSHIYEKDRSDFAKLLGELHIIQKRINALRESILKPK
jgi:four helix bundle protein